MLDRGKLRRVAAAVFMTGWAQATEASDVQAALVQKGLSFELHGITPQPIGHYNFCKLNLSECDVRSKDTSPLRLTNAVWNTIVEVNASVNARIKPMYDMELYGRDEVWTFAESEGDCEDFVLEKREELHQKGIPLSNLLITVVRKRNGEGHAILTVRTDKGDFVLDNLEAHVKALGDTNYKYLKAVDPSHSGRWLTIHRPSEAVTTAATGDAKLQDRLSKPAAPEPRG